MIIGTKADFQELAEFVLRDYLGDDYDTPKPIDIFAFAKDYLKMTVSYVVFPEAERIEGVRYADQIFLDKALENPQCRGARNFTVAHECGHELINWQEASYNPGRLVNCREADEPKRLVTEGDFKEWQANVVGAYLLMRPSLVEWCMFMFSRKEKMTMYGNPSNHIMYYDDFAAVRDMADYLGVSKQAIKYRLIELNLLEQRPMNEYDYAFARYRRVRRCS